MKQWSMILMIAGLICIAEGLVRLKKPDLRFFQIRQTEELEPEQRREYIRKGAVSSICLGAVCPAGGRSVWKNWRYEGFDSALGGNPSFSDLLTLAE